MFALLRSVILNCQRIPQKLEDKVAELLGDTNVDENRIAAEVVIYSDKICVDEETVRLKSHIDGMRDELLKGGKWDVNLILLHRK